jgi:16S rRNA (cytosine1402-N4)-methyltransferase
MTETLTGLSPARGKRFLDGTIGGAGHSYVLLEGSSPDGSLIGLDRDEAALQAAAERLKPFEGRFELHRANFAELERYADPGSCDGVLLDLGVSSPQIDQAERGFSFQNEGPLDMRMDNRDPITAADIVNTWAEDDLANLFYRLGDERASRRIARMIVARRAVKRFTTTKELADAISDEIGRSHQRIHPATRVFQALRMEVNRELESLEEGLRGAMRILKTGGRLAVITFHSLEDRLVKDFGRALERDYAVQGPVDLPEFRTPKTPEARWVSRKAILPSEEEMRENPRSRSAQLRLLEKL